VSSKIINELAYRVSMMLRCTLDGTNSFLLDELCAYLLYFTLAKLLVVERCALGLNKIFIAVQAEISLVPCGILGFLDDILAFFLPKKGTFWVLAYNSYLASWS
jgi:hypothetical protein